MNNIDKIDKLFDIFGLNADANEGDIKKRYRILVKKFHPDKNKDLKSHERFIKIQSIYHILICYVHIRDQNNVPDTHDTCSTPSIENNIKEIMNIVSKYIKTMYGYDIDKYYIPFMNIYNNLFEKS